MAAGCVAICEPEDGLKQAAITEKESLRPRTVHEEDCCMAHLAQQKGEVSISPFELGEPLGFGVLPRLCHDGWAQLGLPVIALVLVDRRQHCNNTPASRVASAQRCHLILLPFGIASLQVRDTLGQEKTNHAPNFPSAAPNSNPSTSNRKQCGWPFRGFLVGVILYAPWRSSTNPVGLGCVARDATEKHQL